VSGRTRGMRIYLTLIGLGLAGIGAVFAWLMGRSFLRAVEIDSWPVTEAVIVDSGTDERRVDPSRGSEWRLRVLYSYEWGGEERLGDRYRLRGASWTHKRDQIGELLERYPVGAVVECRVNPEDPDFALLRGESRAPGYALWFPLLFVVGGIGAVVGAWRR